MHPVARHQVTPPDFGSGKISNRLVMIPLKMLRRSMALLSGAESSRSSRAKSLRAKNRIRETGYFSWERYEAANLAYQS
jgi:hypothetical protein